MTRIQRRIAGGLGGLLAAAATTACLVAPAAHASGAATPHLDGLRQATVDRAYTALTNVRGWRYTATGANQNSSLHLSDTPAYNYLGKDGSNTNRNVYDDFNGLAWCGYFAAAIWTAHNVPSASAFPNIPADYPSSQAWRTGSLFHTYSASKLPKPGDVLVWQDGAGNPGVDNGSGTGHVGVVVDVNTSTKWVTTVEGNQWVYNADGSIRNKDSIVKHSYHWVGNGPTLSGKHFMGFRSRE